MTRKELNPPLSGTYEVRRNIQFQTPLPVDMRNAYVERQDKKSIRKCWIYMSRQNDKLIIKDVITRKESPDFPRVNFGLDGRFVARFKDEDGLKQPEVKDLIFKGFYDYIEVTKAH